MVPFFLDFLLQVGLSASKPPFDSSFIFTGISACVADVVIKVVVAIGYGRYTLRTSLLNLAEVTIRSGTFSTSSEESSSIRKLNNLLIRDLQVTS